jgi:predicted nucleotidyltransferase
MAEPTPEIIESHYLETTDGLFFAVKGLVHPPDRLLAILRYAPDPNGERVKDGRRYRRLYHFEEQERLLREHYPHYLAFDPVCQITLQSVPRSHVRRVYDPRARLQELLDRVAIFRADPSGFCPVLAGRGQGKPEGSGGHRPFGFWQTRRVWRALEADVLAFARLLQQEAGVPWSSLGVSGSLLIGLHSPDSDLDLTVYGVREGWAVHRALKRLLAEETGGVSRLDARGIEALYAERVADTRMAFADFVASEQDKVFQGYFRGRPYFVRFLKAPAEIAESYGDHRYTPLGRIGIEAVVSDADEAIFTPCRYAVQTRRVFGDPSGLGDSAGLIEIVSFRGRFCEQAQVGDLIRACGTLERVETRDGRVWFRLLLGNHPDDTMLANPKGLRDPSGLHGGEK